MTIRNRVLFALLAVTLAVVGMTMASAPATAADDTVVLVGGTAVVPAGLEDHLDACAGTTERLAGDDRYATAAAISQRFTDPDVVFLTTGEKFPDSLAAGPIGALIDAPVLLTRQSSLPAVTKAALVDLDPSLVVIVGGTAVVAESVEAEVSALFPVSRIAGANRYETASLLSQWHFTDPGLVDTVLIATGEDFLDALVAGPIATRENAPLLLTPGDVLPSLIQAEIARLGVSKAIIVGAEGIVSTGVELALEGLVADVERVAGSSRYTTAAIAADMAGVGGDVFVVTSHDFPDGLAAVPAANGDPIVFTGSNGFPAASADAVSDRIGAECDEWYPPYPQVGSGKRVIYTLSGHHLWMIDENERLVDHYDVTGREGIPHPGTYQVYSKSVNAYAPYGGITMKHMVRFVRPRTFGNQWAYGFHSIPRYSNGRPLMAEEDLGSYGSGGCVRQADHKAAAMYDWAGIGTTVIVLP